MISIAKILPEVTQWRRQLHAHPELAYKEFKTSLFVQEQLKQAGLEVHTGIAETGVVGVLDRGPGPVIGIRGDMDALPLLEKTDLPFASQTPGVMHACGHDAHTAMVLGAAKILAQCNDLKGKVVFIFQPAEENEGGAKRMVEEGLFEQFPLDAVFGLHNMPGVPVGEVWVKSGVVSASFDTFDIKIQGRGGHGAMPDKSLDPIPVASAMISALNTVVSRNIAPLESAVLSVCSIQGGDTYNVIPDEVVLKGSCRALCPDQQLTLKQRIIEIVHGIAQAHGVQADLCYEERYPPVINAENEAALLKQVVQKNTGRWKLVDDFDPVMGSEDFSFFLQQVPGCYFMIGNGFDSGPLHAPTYEFNEDSLEVGLGLWVELVKHLLSDN